MDKLGFLSSKVAENKKVLQKKFALAADAVFRDGYLGGDKKIPFLLFYLDNTVNGEVINRDILNPLLYEQHLERKWTSLSGDLREILQKNCNSGAQLKEVDNWEELLPLVLYGWIAVFLEGERTALLLQSPGWPKRSPSSPQMEKEALSSRVGLVENLADNIALLRMRIRSLDLAVERTDVGNFVPSYVGIVYMQSRVDQKLLKRIKEKLNELNVEGLILSGELTQFLEDNPFYFFPKTRITQRMELITASLVEGKIVLILDGSPYAIIFPISVQSFFVVSDDYSERYIPASFLRVIRILALFIAILLPGFYTALATLNMDLIPYDMLLNIARSRQSVIFSPLQESLFLGFFLDVLQEGSLRVPGPISQTVGIVGGIALGQAIVSAKIVGPMVVIVISLTAVSSFVASSYRLTLVIKVLRVAFILLGGFLGLYGLTLGVLFMFTILAATNSFNEPYFAPYAPFGLQNMKDGIIKFPPSLGATFLKKNRKVLQEEKNDRRTTSDN